MKLKFSRIELKELLYADIMLTIAFSILFTVFTKTNSSTTPQLILTALLFLPIMLIVMTLSFVIHELSHKYVAQKFKYIAEFRANKGMLWMTVILSFLGFIIAAPGAVHILSQNSIDPKKNGMIAFAGPFSNIIVAIIFFGLTFVSSFVVFQYIYFINAVLAVFNMLPLPRFDGQKVWKWNKAIYIIAGIIALMLYSLPLMIAAQ